MVQGLVVEKWKIKDANCCACALRVIDQIDVFSGTLGQRTLHASYI